MNEERSGLEVPPVRVCCGQRHFGVECPDGLVMCCLCFERFTLPQLAWENGSLVNICKPCHIKDTR